MPFERCLGAAQATRESECAPRARKNSLGNVCAERGQRNAIAFRLALVEPLHVLISTSSARSLSLAIAFCSYASAFCFLVSWLALRAGQLKGVCINKGAY